MNNFNKIESSHLEIKASIKEFDWKCLTLVKQQQILINNLQQKCDSFEQKLLNMESKNIPMTPTSTTPIHVTSKTWLHSMLTYVAIPLAMVLFMVLEPLKGIINLFVRLFFWQITKNKRGRLDDSKTEHKNSGRTKTKAA